MGGRWWCGVSKSVELPLPRIKTVSGHTVIQFKSQFKSLNDPTRDPAPAMPTTHRSNHSCSFKVFWTNIVQLGCSNWHCIGNCKSATSQGERNGELSCTKIQPNWNRTCIPWRSIRLTHLLKSLFRGGLALLKCNQTNLSTNRCLNCRLDYWLSDWLHIADSNYTPRYGFAL